MSSASPSVFGLPYFDHSHLDTTIATVVILGLFFVSFVFILYCRFIFEHVSRSSSDVYTDFSVNSDGNINDFGLDPFIKEMFPTFRYSAVKGCSQGGDGLQCAICLSDMEDEDVLRLLTVCCHVFHQECIDRWLGTQRTCPVCRANLSNPEKHHNICPMFQNTSVQVLNGSENEPPPSDHTVVDLSREESKYGHEQVTLTVEGGGEWPERGGAEKFPKAHSTGHSIILVSEEKDSKYRLLLTAPVRAQIVKGHRCVKSCTIFRDFTDKPSLSPGDSST
uniref:RING-type E3 ubiquitin transferase n=1 Tax=Kalanchoe fedtschenkoi TaxID=63787 RepID=A0A7N1A5K7_KALFE